jgi:NitT/TauT family transport system substrate-binding protein
MARAGGAYREAGLEVEFVCPDVGVGDGLDYLLTGRCDFAVSYPNRLMARVSAGAGLRSVAALDQRPMESLVTLAGRPVARAAGLEGLRVAHRRSPRLDALLTFLVSKDGGDPGKVERIVLYPEEPMPERLAEGEFDAAFGALWAWEGLHGPVLGGLDLCHREVDGLGAPAYPAQVLATGSRDQGLVGSFVEATRRGAARAAAAREETVSVLHEAAPFLPRGLLAASLDAVVPLWGGEGWGAHPRRPLQEYRDWLAGVGLLQGPVDTDQTFVDPEVTL